MQAIVQVDAFSEGPFTGNPAAVCVLDRPAPDAWMQAVALEMNLSETAFLWREDDGYRLRWFTPKVEVDLCGHATLASAHVLWEEHHLAVADEAAFLTRSGRLTARRDGEWIELNFPATPCSEAEAPAGLAEALGAQPLFVGKSRFDYLVQLPDEDTVRALQPDFTALARLPVRGVMVTAQGSAHDFVSRFFAPASGVPEDPVTGSAHCCLGPFWGERLGRSRLVAYQASARGGLIRIELVDDRVRLSGKAVTTMRGTLTAAAGPAGCL